MDPQELEINTLLQLCRPERTRKTQQRKAKQLREERQQTLLRTAMEAANPVRRGRDFTPPLRPRQMMR